MAVTCPAVGESVCIGCRILKYHSWGQTQGYDLCHQVPKQPVGFLIFWTFYAIFLQNDISHVSHNRNPYQLKNIFKKNKKFFRTSNSFCICVLMCWCAHLQDGKPPPKNMLKRSSGVMSASKPLWKSKPAPCEWLGLLGSSPPVRSYCRRLSALLSTAYALPISRKESRVSRMELENLFFSFSSSKIFIFI